MVSTVIATLEQRPERFDAIGMRLVAHPHERAGLCILLFTKDSTFYVLRQLLDAGERATANGSLRDQEESGSTTLLFLIWNSLMHTQFMFFTCIKHLKIILDAFEKYIF